MPVQPIPNTARRAEPSPQPVPTAVAPPSPSSGPVNMLVGTDCLRGDPRTVHTRRAGGTQTAPPQLNLPIPFPTTFLTAPAAPAPVHLLRLPSRLNYADYCGVCLHRG